MNKHTFIDTVDDIFTRAKQAGIFHLTPDNDQLDGRLLSVDGKDLINFGSCSYLGLEKHPFVIQGVIAAAQNYGSQFSSSRAYMSCPLYDQLESLLQQISGYPSLVTPSTTLGHFSSIPTLITIDDVIILDHQVHASVQSAVRQVKASGVKTDMIKHSDLESLEQKINQYRHHKNKIWYCLDGVYSMYGDFAPLQELVVLQQKYSQLNLYIDDAHGFSWTGKFGKGYVLSQIKLNDRIVVAASLNKAFATSGGVIFFGNEEQKRKVRTCGGTLIFSGPIQPPMLGAAINSAKLHLNGEVKERQKQLSKLTNLCSKEFKRLNLPDMSNAQTPIFYIATSLLDSGFELVNQMMKKGKYVNIGLYPAVPIVNTGVRFTLNTHLFEQDVIDLCQDLSNSYSEALYSKGANVEQVINAFNLEPKLANRFIKQYKKSESKNKSLLKMNVSESFSEVNQKKWCKKFSDDSFLQPNYLDAIEKTFSKKQPNQNIQLNNETWQFYYLCIYDANEQLVLATMFTKCHMKDDMFLSKNLSEKVEQVRLQDKNAYSSRVLMMGSLISEGNHLYVDTKHPHFKDAVKQMLKWVKQNSKDVSGLILRDFVDIHPDVHELFIQQGFIKTQGLNNHKVLGKTLGDNIEQWQMNLKPKYRYFQRSYVLSHFKQSLIKVKSAYNVTQLDYFYRLYLNVQKKAREINTFALPKVLFENLIKLENSEIIEVYTDQGSKRTNQPQVMALCLHQGEHYFAVVAAIDYANKQQAIYRQLLVAINERAREKGVEYVHLGFGASLEKRRVGALANENYLYIQQLQHFSFEAMNEMSVEVNK
ncbi:MAG: GNAT family N-acetyltransferase [Saccharospirillaceae bacterium]|nr:bifunctional aminotransferase class I/II-fold pyridoxal phosphate-dependent enzyme/GNAT family N-acetyltransferase [Pseudomonadales bacterium]NRB80735.1 GNAT family N-acetyltransferase [Saccharospirillaceae bacterium]